jgi:hypothetical protein
MPPFDNYYVVEFSVSQRAFHTHTVKEMIKKNVTNLTDGKQSDFMVIGMFENKALADTFIHKYKALDKQFMFTDYRGEKIIN